MSKKRSVCSLTAINLDDLVLERCAMQLQSPTLISHQEIGQRYAHILRTIALKHHRYRVDFRGTVKPRRICASTEPVDHIASVIMTVTARRRRRNGARFCLSHKRALLVDAPLIRDDLMKILNELPMNITAVAVHLDGSWPPLDGGDATGEHSDCSVFITDCFRCVHLPNVRHLAFNVSKISPENALVSHWTLLQIFAPSVRSVSLTGDCQFVNFASFIEAAGACPKLDSLSILNLAVRLYMYKATIMAQLRDFFANHPIRHFHYESTQLRSATWLREVLVANPQLSSLTSLVEFDYGANTENRQKRALQAFLLPEIQLLTRRCHVKLIWRHDLDGDFDTDLDELTEEYYSEQLTSLNLQREFVNLPITIDFRIMVACNQYIDVIEGSQFRQRVVMLKFAMDLAQKTNRSIPVLIQLAEVTSRGRLIQWAEQYEQQLTYYRVTNNQQPQNRNGDGDRYDVQFIALTAQ